MSRLDGKTALVTGATGGIGEAIATRFVEEGSSVMLVDRSPEKLDATAGRLAGSGNMATCVADVTDEAAVADAVAATVESFGGLDILVAAATPRLARARHLAENLPSPHLSLLAQRLDRTAIFRSIRPRQVAK